MTDVVDKVTRSRMMSGIKGKNTKPEMIIRSGLHKRGFRFRVHDKRLKGTPDIVLPRYRAIIQVHGCFWHGHDCHLFKWPQSRPEFWREKISGTQSRDQKNLAEYIADQWSVLTIWECALKGQRNTQVERVLDACGKWIATTDRQPNKQLP